MKKYLLTVIALFVFLPFFAASEVRADDPAEEPKNGWVTEKKQTYYYKEGKAVKGWQKIKKKWYFFHKKRKYLRRIRETNPEDITMWIRTVSAARIRP